MEKTQQLNEAEFYLKCGLRVFWFCPKCDNAVPNVEVIHLGVGVTCPQCGCQFVKDFEPVVLEDHNDYKEQI